MVNLTKAIICLAIFATSDVPENGVITSKPIEHFTAEQGSIKTNNIINAWMRILPNEGWKFNDNYPTKFKIDTTGYELLKFEINKEEEADARKIQLIIKQENDESKEIKVKARFSICNDVSCKVYKRVFTL